MTLSELRLRIQNPCEPALVREITRTRPKFVYELLVTMVMLSYYAKAWPNAFRKRKEKK